MWSRGQSDFTTLKGGPCGRQKRHAGDPLPAKSQEWENLDAIIVYVGRSTCKRPRLPRDKANQIRAPLILDSPQTQPIDWH